MLEPRVYFNETNTNSDIDWRDEPNTGVDDDEVLDQTPDYVTGMLGFDPLDLDMDDAFNPDQPRDDQGQWVVGDGQAAAVENIRRFLEMVKDIHGDRPNTAKFLLEHGRQFRMTKDTFSGKKGTPKLCFMNAAELSMADSSKTYVEGYVTIHGVPIEHAWVADEFSNVIDPTIRNQKGIGGYFGVAFGPEYLNNTLLKNKVYGLLGYESYKTLLPLLEGKVNFKDYDPDQPRDYRGRWTDMGLGNIDTDVVEKIEEAQRKADAIPDTHLDNNPARVAMRQHIEDMLYEKDISTRTRGRNATIILGMPASGKSALADTLVASGALEIDPDLVKEHIPEFAGGIGSSATHEESSMITRKILQRAITNGDDIVWPRVDGEEKIVRDVKSLVAAGYKVHVKYIDVSLKTAINSAIDRFNATGRLVKPMTIIAYGDTPKKSFEMIKVTGLLTSYEEYRREHRKGLERVG